MKSLVEALGMDCTCIPRIATGFGAGMGRHGETCGAVVGAIMALGLKYGREDVTDAESKADTYAKVESLLQAFKDKYGTVVCRDLIGCDFQTPEGNERFKRENMHVNLCAKFVAFAARDSLSLLQE